MTFGDRRLLSTVQVICTQVLWCVKQCAFIFWEVVIHQQPRQFALIIHMGGWFEILRCLQRRRVKVHPSRVVVGFEPDR